MQLFPRSFKRPVLLLAIGGALIFLRLKQTWWKWPDQVYDEAALLDTDVRFQANAALAEVTKATGVDIRVLLVDSLAGEPIEMYALRRMRELDVGSTTDRRGILVVMDLGARRVRVEIGPKLEGIMTDSYAGYVARDLLSPALAGGTDPHRLLIMVTHILRFRIIEGLLGNEWDPAVVTDIRERQRLAVGGGAHSLVTLDDLSRLAQQPAPADRLRYYVPQPGAYEALARYLDWVQEPFSYPDVPLFTKQSHALLLQNRDNPVAAWRFDQLSISKERYQLTVRDSLAVAIPTSSPQSHPVWFSRGTEGWQVDMRPAWSIVQGLIASPWTWQIRTGPDPWVDQFADLLERMPHQEYYIVRFRMGNNTPIPERGSYR